MLAVAAASCGSPSNAPDPGFKINYVETSAETIVDGQSRPAKVGDAVSSKAVVRAKDGAVDIGIDAGRAVRLVAGSEAELHGSGGKDGREVEVDLKMGTMLANLKSAEAGPIRFRVATPSGVCGARGTAFFVKSDPGEMTVGVESGEVSLHGTAGGEVQVPAGKKAVAKLTTPVTDIDNLLETERELLSQVNLMNFVAVLDATRKIIAAADVKSIESGLEMFRAMNGAYPERLEEAMEGTKDPWGNPFNYIPNGARDNYELSSSGPDGKVNTSDDIRLK